MNTTTDWAKRYRVEVGGDEVGSHAGNVIVRMLADRSGLTDALSAAISRPEVTHDGGALLRDVAVSIADGATNLSGTRVLRDGDESLYRQRRMPDAKNCVVRPRHCDSCGGGLLSRRW